MNPRNWLTFDMLGTTYVQLKNYGEAIRNYTEALHLEPKQATTLAALSPIANDGNTTRRLTILPKLFVWPLPMVPRIWNGEALPY